MKARQIIRIAYADDHVMVRDGITELLHSAKWSVDFRVVISAENGNDLIQKLEKTANQPDVCLLDLYMPDMDAWATLPVLRKRWPGMNILIVTMEKDEVKANQMMASGAKGYLMKSGNPTVLMNAIEVIYKGGFYHHMVNMQMEARLQIVEILAAQKINLPLLI